jgi:hypothetical protein
MATTEHIIARALSRIAVLRIGKAPTSIQAKDGLDAANEMLLSLQADGVYIDPVIPIPEKHLPGLIAMLAIRLAPDYGVDPPVLLQREANAGFKALLAAYIFAPDANFDPALRNLPSQRLLGQRGTPFDIVSSIPSSSPSVTGFCVLLAGSPTTTFTDANCLTTSTITLTPYSRSALEEWDNIRPIVAAGPAAGQFTVTHANNAITDRTFEYLIVI